MATMENPLARCCMKLKRSISALKGQLTRERKKNAEARELVQLLEWAKKHHQKVYIRETPLDIEINEGLFDNVIRMNVCIGFTANHTGGEEPTKFRIYGNGMIAGTNVGLSPSPFNEIIRTRSALGWTGE